MAFRSKKKSHSAIVKTLREAGRDRDPASLPFYMSKNPAKLNQSRTGGTYSAAFKGMTIPWRLIFQLKCMGKPFNYQGVITKQYTTKTVCFLFGIERVTVHRWMEKGILPRPILVVNTAQGERSTWFYHQIQPVYVWYMYLRSRGIKRVAADDTCEYGELVKNLSRSQIRFEKLLGIEQIDEYTLIAGRYGAIPIDP